MEFTYDAYEKLIETLKAKKYFFGNYKNYKNHEKVVILRHDVDMSLEKSLELAKLENKLGVMSTYYILISSDFYNIYSKKSNYYIKEIIKLGHEIGLHFDEERYEKTEDVVCNIEKEIDILELCLGGKINSVSMHRPSKETLAANYEIKSGEIVNSYSKEFFEVFKYVSDSRKNWLENIMEIAELDKFNKLHILTHPIWYTKSDETIKETLLGFVKQATKERYNSLKDNIKDFEQIITLNEM